MRSTSKLTYYFFSAHSSLLDAVDRYLTETHCAEEVSLLLHDFMVSVQGPHEGNLVYGPGCAIMTYCAMRYTLRMTGEEAYELTAQGLLVHEKSRRERAWKAMSRKVMSELPLQSAVKYRHSYPTVYSSVEIPPIQRIPGPLWEARCFNFS